MSRTTKTALVTGSSAGMGFDIARAFLARGDNVILNGRDPDRLAVAATELGAPEQVAVVPGDIGDRSTGQKMVVAALQRFGAVDILVNNAGTFGLRPFLDVSEAEIDGFLRGNLRGTYLTTQTVVREMVSRGGGSIVNIGTVLVDHPSASLPASAALISKGGVHALTTSLAAELAPRGITVNGVAPGVIRTTIYGDADVDALAGVALLERVGDVADTTAAVLYLADAPFTTGHILRVDGGYVSGRA